MERLHELLFAMVEEYNGEFGEGTFHVIHNSELGSLRRDEIIDGHVTPYVSSPQLTYRE